MAHWKTSLGIASFNHIQKSSSVHKSFSSICGTCVHICPRPSANACLYRLEVNIWHLPYSSLVFEAGSLSEFVARWLARLVGQWALWICLSPWLQHGSHSCILLCHLFIQGHGFKLRFSWLRTKARLPTEPPTLLLRHSFVGSPGWSQAPCFWGYRCLQHVWPHFEICF